MKYHAECPMCGSMVRTLVIAVNPAKLQDVRLTTVSPIMCQDCASKHPGVKFKTLAGVVTV